MQAEPKEVSADKATTPGQQAPQWTHAKPTGPGAYWVRGFRIGEPNSRPALVEVARNDDGTLVCNMNDSNTNDQLCEWSFVEDLAERFEWFGPLSASRPEEQRLVGYLDSAYVQMLQERPKITCTLYANPSDSGNFPVYAVEVPHA
jgi:hypothetical protein